MESPKTLENCQFVQEKLPKFTLTHLLANARNVNLRKIAVFK